jgi:hypothetical protein
LIVGISGFFVLIVLSLWFSRFINPNPDEIIFVGWKKQLEECLVVPQFVHLGRIRIVVRKDNVLAMPTMVSILNLHRLNF